METVFDHNITDEEIKALEDEDEAGFIQSDANEDDNAFWRDVNIEHISALYEIRGDKEISEKYYNMLPEELRKSREYCDIFPE